MHESLALRHRFLQRLSRALCALTAMLCVCCLELIADDASSKPQTKTVDFRADVFPILSKHCLGCHQGRDAESGIRLDDRRELLGETNGVPLVAAGKSAKSRLIEVVTGSDPKTQMPPEGERLSQEQISILRNWIDQGISWDESLLPPVLQGSGHWAFQPIQCPSIPADGNRWSDNPIDRFIAARQKELGLQPVMQAEPEVLIRRLSLDLLGLPPSTDEVERFVVDRSPHAYGDLVERLLASPHYGERWGRHWLDVARWAESEGYESNHPRPFAWRYRDYVIESFNSDRPFDQFILQQLAGDELTPYSDENLIATGFLAAARLSSNEEDKWLQRNDMNVDIVNAVGSAFLGLTIHCAQCHNHKFDPISSRDYYGLHAFFVRGQPADIGLREPEHRTDYETHKSSEYEPALALKEALFAKARERYDAEVRSKLTAQELAAYDKPSDQRTVAEELLARKVDLKFQRTPDGIEKHLPEADRPLYEQLEKKIAAIEKSHPLRPQTFAFYSPVTSRHELEVLPALGFYPLPFDADAFAKAQPYLMIRGDVHAIGPTVQPHWPALFDALFEFEPPEELTGTRRALAQWLTHPRNPLTARVWVNRIWHYHFGRGIVASPSDFGVEGEQPSHPELLDWLAAELIESGWSTKHIHRLILNSATYRLSSQVVEANGDIDPDNTFLWHWRPRRLDAEVVRDAMLAMSGELDLTLAGPSVPLVNRETSPRRSLYLFQKRGLPPRMQKLFDGLSESAESCSRRITSTSPLQSLYLLNDEFSFQRAERLASRLWVQSGSNWQEFVGQVFHRALSRSPEAEELAAAHRFLEQFESAAENGNETQNGDSKEVPEAAIWFCHSILNLNEFVYVE